MINLYAEGVYIDMWTLTHFLFGVILFFPFTIKKVNIYIQIILTFLVAFFWEVFEISVKIIEYPTNRVVDIFVTVLGLILFYYLNQKNNFVYDNRFKYSIIAFYLLLCAVGWLSYVFL